MLTGMTKDRRERLARIALTTDYSAPTPLWSDAGWRPHADMGLTPPLLARLEAWNDLFQEHYHWDGGWRDAQARASFAALSHHLVRDLERELDPTEVVLDDWTGALPGRRRR